MCAFANIKKRSNLYISMALFKVVTHTLKWFRFLWFMMEVKTYQLLVTFVINIALAVTDPTCLIEKKITDSSQSERTI